MGDIRRDGTTLAPTAECPSPDDHIAWQQHLESELQSTTKGCNELREREQFAREDTTVYFPEAWRRRLEKLKQHATVLASQLAAGASRRVGTVVLTSGLAVDNKFLRDWALVALDSTRFPNLSDVTNVSVLKWLGQIPIFGGFFLTKFSRTGPNIS
jgi:hypothetical protein